VNGAESIARILATAPRVVVINGTRILKKATLEALKVPVLNTHVGITPRYRGVHGAYWALVNRDRAHCGVTVHFVAPGIDTGGVIHQRTIDVTERDNFTTYPVLQMAVGSTILVRAVQEVLDGTVRTIAGTPDDKRWYHPTILEYLTHRIAKGVK
jgi:folate-dependent phosphoribosylglycinamide formyltransferase PurN